MMSGQSGNLSRLLGVAQPGRLSQRVFLALLLSLTASPKVLATEKATYSPLSAFCISLYQSVRSAPQLPAHAELSRLQAAYRELQSSSQLHDRPKIDSQRLINEDDWERARATHPEKPWLHYGRSTMSDWLRGLRFVGQNANDMPLSTELLKKIHSITAAQLPFHGYEGRRIRQLYDQGEISKERFQELLHQAYKENKSVSGTDHRQLVGTFRSSSIDEIEHNGSSFDELGRRYFSSKELAAIRSNPYMRVDESSVKTLGAGKFEARAFYHPVANVEGSVEQVLRQTQSEIDGALTLEQQVKSIIKMQRDLISIHPFLDGNGRSIRLLGDLMYQRIGLPPPLHPNESDLVMGVDEAYEFTRRSMVDYLNSHKAQGPRRGARP
jgi:hypothetical protein